MEGKKIYIRSLAKAFILMNILLAACGREDTLWEEYHPISAKTWYADSVQHFTFSVQDTAPRYVILIQTANTNDYPYSNIWFFTHLETEQNNRITDTLEFDLATPAGKWLGKKKGENYLLRHVYRYGVKFARPGNYRLIVQQGMRTDHLQGIAEVGLVINKLNE